jgi:hypothetical protein
MIRQLALAAVLCGLPSLSAAQILGAPAAPLETPYQSEHAWALREITADINEIARYRAKVAAPSIAIDTIVPWHPELLTAYAAAQLAGGTARDSGNEPPDQHDKLLDLTPDSILKANAVISAALKREMRNPRAHEAAALLLSAFALRESAGGLSDTRWALNRMTAHLAVAQALRGTATAASIDGQIAGVALLALSNRERSAIAALDALTMKTPAAEAWQRALRMRVTEDWRVLALPFAATRLEKLTYFRARRYTLRGIRGGQELTDLREPPAVDFARVLQSRSFGVEDGQQFVINGLGAEVSELAYVYKQMHQRELPEALPATIINVRAGRLLAAGDPQVIPWGAWAEFAQRHIGQSIDKIDRLYRHQLGMPDRADELKAALGATLRHLTLYPVASVAWTKGKKGTEADLRYLNEAVDVAVRSPELVTFDYWKFMQQGVRYEPVKRGMPAMNTWFTPLSADVPYDAAMRTESLIAYLKPPAIDALMDEAPYDIGMLSRIAQRYGRLRPVMLKIRGLVEPRIDFDMWVIDWAINTARDWDDRLALRRKACALAIGQCLALADDLADVDEAAAVAEYEKAFRNPALDQISMSNASGWLVEYYERTGQLVKAMDLAQRSAAVYSGRGLATLAHLLERRARIAEAEEVFMAMSARYPDSLATLAGFLYRQAVTGKNAAYLARWTAIEKGLFPNGLQPMATVMSQKPENGVFVEEDSASSRRVRLQAGDIIVGVDGWKVENKQQYDAAIALLPPHTKHKLTAWRGILFTVDLYANNGMTLKTHPLKGWIE